MRGEERRDKHSQAGIVQSKPSIIGPFLRNLSTTFNIPTPVRARELTGLSGDIPTIFVKGSDMTSTRASVQAHARRARCVVVALEVERMGIRSGDDVC